MLPSKYSSSLEDTHEAVFEKILGGYKCSIVLDAGCGDATQEISHRAQLAGQLVGIDNHLSLRASIPRRTLPSNFRFVAADAKAMPFRDNYFDVILMLGLYSNIDLSEIIRSHNPTLPQKFSDLYHHPVFVPRRQKLLSECGRVLKESGILIVSNSLSNSPLEDTINEFNNYFAVKDVYKGQDRYLLICGLKHG